MTQASVSYMFQRVGGTMARQNDQVRWCILRTGGPRTLPLARSLAAAGFEVWTPKRTFKRPKPGARPNAKGQRPMIETDAPIIPTFVFANGRHVFQLLALAADPVSAHPAFSLLRDGDRVPIITERGLEGLRLAEREADELIARLRDIDAAKEKRLARAELLRTQAQRRKALRKERIDLRPGERVSLKDAPAFAGMSGVVESSDGATAWVSFGGSLRVIVEAWQIIPDEVQLARPVIGIAA